MCMAPGGRRAQAPFSLPSSAPTRRPAERPRSGSLAVAGASQPAPGPQRREARAWRAPCNADTVRSRRRAVRLQRPCPLRLPHQGVPGGGELQRRLLPRPAEPVRADSPRVTAASTPDTFSGQTACATVQSAPASLRQWAWAAFFVDRDGGE